jgi:hypothetical protein
MTTNETWLQGPRGGSRVSASKGFFITNRERPIGWRTGCRLSKRIRTRNLSRSRIMCKVRCRRAGWTNRWAKLARERRSAVSLCVLWSMTGESFLAGSANEIGRWIRRLWPNSSWTVRRPLCVRAIRWKRRNRCSKRATEALFSSPTQTESCSAHFSAPQRTINRAANSSCRNRRSGLDRKISRSPCRSSMILKSHFAGFNAVVSAGLTNRDCVACRDTRCSG